MRAEGSISNHPLIVLGIEGSANKIGVGIVSSTGEILANPRCTYVTPAGTGFLPRETAVHHRSKILKLVRKSLKISKLKFDKITAIAYTKGPGMGSCLCVGALVARMLSQLWRVPLVPVNHCIAHIEMGRFVTSAQNPIILYVSGGNTQVIAYRQRKYVVVGETLDIAIGNCIDRVARLLKLPNYPAPGSQIEKAAKRYENTNRNHVRPRDSLQNNDACRSNKKARQEQAMHSLYGKHAYTITPDTYSHPPYILDLPYNVKGMDMSFTGILSKVEEIINGSAICGSPTIASGNPPQFIGSPITSSSVSESSGESLELVQCFENKMPPPLSIDLICYSFEEHIYTMLIEVTERAMAYTGCNDVLIVGGVGCNGRLQRMMKTMCEERDGKICCMNDDYCIDNGAMIAYTGLKMFQSLLLQKVPIESMNSADIGIGRRLDSCGFQQRFRTDEVHVHWRDD